MEETDLKFTMTWEWLHLFSTPGGGWTAAQLRTIGVPWPPKRGWLKRSVGQQITTAQREAFERLHAERQIARADRPRTKRGQARKDQAFEVTVIIRKVK